MQPTLEDVAFETWAMENDKVRSWLVDSMTPALSNRYIKLPTAKEIWTALRTTYYESSDQTRLFELNRKCFLAKQNGRILSAYYNELVSLFQEIDERLSQFGATSSGTTAASVVQAHTTTSVLRVHMFLSGLDPVFDQVRSEILRKDPPFNLEQSYAHVRKVQTDREVMSSSSISSEASVMAANRHQGPPPGFPNPPKNRLVTTSSNSSHKPQKSLKCSHCGEDGHTKQRCYLIIGYPDWWDFTKKPRKQLGKTALAVNEFDTTPTANVAHPGTIGKTNAFSAKSSNNT